MNSIKNFLICDASNAYKTLGFGEYHYLTGKEEQVLFEEKRFLKRLGDNQKCATFIYENYRSPKNLMNEESGLCKSDYIFFGAFVPIRISGDNRRNTHPHGIMFSCKAEDFDFNPANFINSKDLIKAFEIVSSHKGNLDEINNELTSLPYDNIGDDSCDFGDSTFTDRGIDAFGLDKTTNKKRLVLEVIDKLIATNFKEPVIVVADEKDLALIVKSVLTILGKDIAKHVSFVVNATTKEHCLSHLLVAVSDEMPKELYAECKNVLRYSSVDEVYDTTFVNAISALPEFDPNVYGGDDKLLKLISDGKFSAYYDNCLSKVNFGGSLESNCNLVSSFLDNYPLADCYDFDAFKGALEAIFIDWSNSFGYKKEIMTSLEKLPIKHQKLIDYIVYAKDKGDELYSFFVKAAIREIFTPLRNGSYLPENSAKQLIQYFEAIIASSDNPYNVLQVNGIRQAFYSGGFNFYEAFKQYINEDNHYFGTLVSYAVTCLNFLVFSGKVTEITASDVIGTIFENISNTICTSFVNRAFRNEKTSLKEKYTMMKYLLINASSIDLTTLDVVPGTDSEFDVYIKNEIKKIVEDSTNLTYNVNLVHELSAEGVDGGVKQFIWLLFAAVPDFLSIDELMSANLSHQRNHDEDLDLAIHYKSSLFFSRYLEKDNLAIKEVINDSNIAAIYDFYHSSYSEPLTDKQKEIVKENDLLKYIDELYADYSSNNNAYQFLFASETPPIGLFAQKRRDFIKLTSNIPDADNQTKSIFSFSTSNFAMGFIWLLVSIGLLVPIYLLNKTVFYCVAFMPALSALASVIINIAFAKSSHRVLSWHVFRANLWGVFIPELIVIAVLVILMSL